MLASAGTLLVTPYYVQTDTSAAALYYYLFQYTPVGTAFFLLAKLIVERRGRVSDTVQPGPALHAPWLALSFFLTATPTIVWQRAAAVLLLVAAGSVQALFARPVADYAAHAAAQLHAQRAYIDGVLGKGKHAIAWKIRP